MLSELSATAPLSRIGTIKTPGRLSTSRASHLHHPQETPKIALLAVRALRVGGARAGDEALRDDLARRAVVQRGLALAGDLTGGHRVAIGAGHGLAPRVTLYLRALACRVADPDGLALRAHHGQADLALRGGRVRSTAVGAVR